MILYNLTFNVEDDVKDDWLDYMKNRFIPAMLESGLLTMPVLSELLLDEPQGTSYALHFQVNDMEDLRRFQRKEWRPILEALYKQFGDKVVFFPTEMKVIYEKGHPRK